VESKRITGEWQYDKGKTGLTSYLKVEWPQQIKAAFRGIYITVPGLVPLSLKEKEKEKERVKELVSENGVVLLHGVRRFVRGCGSSGTEQEQQGPNQHLFSIQFLQEQLSPCIFPHDGYRSLSFSLDLARSLPSLLSFPSICLFLLLFFIFHFSIPIPPMLALFFFSRHNVLLFFSSWNINYLTN